MWEFEELMILPGTEQERDWLAERLSTLSKKEKHIVSAIVISARPESMAEAINQLLSMEDYGVCFPREATHSWGAFISGTKPICRNALCTTRIWNGSA